MSHLGDRNLLFGILALEDYLISRDAFIAAMKTWVADKSKGMAQILREQKALSENHQAVVEERVHNHLAERSNDVARSLADVRLPDSVKRDLEKIGDADLSASLARVAAPIVVAPAPKTEAPIVVAPTPRPVQTPRPVKPAAKQKATAKVHSAPEPKKSSIPTWAWMVCGGLVVFTVVFTVIVGAAVGVIVLKSKNRPPIANLDKKDNDKKDDGKKDGEKPDDKKNIDPGPVVVDRKPTEIVGDATWRVDKDELIADNANSKRAYLFFGSKDWGDFDFTFETKSESGRSGTLALFRALDEANHYGLSLGSFLSAKHSLSRTEKGVLNYDVPHYVARYNLNQWYQVRIEARGKQIKCFVDDEKIFDYTNDANARGQLALGVTPEARARWKNLKVMSPNGKTLWNGLPELTTPVVVPPVTQEFISLFNGKDLTGWQPHAQQPGDWRVVDGVLTSFAPVNGYLLTTRDDFKDFHLRMEVRSKKGGGGVKFRYQKTLQGYETTLNPFIDGNFIVRKSGEGVRTLGKIPPFVVNDWTTFEVIAQGNRLQFKVNGRPVHETVDERSAFVSGHLCLYDFRQAIEFRKIEIKELAPAAPPVVVGPRDFVPLFNGKDLTGWKEKAFVGGWRVENGNLIGAPPPQRFLRLHTEKQYKDFHLRAEVKSGDRNLAMIGFRSPDGIVRGYNTSMMSLADGGVRTGIINVQTMQKGFTLRRIEEVKIPPGDWFNLEVIAQGDKLQILVNGQKTTDAVDASIPEEGFIYLGISGQSTVEFRKIEIKELEAVPIAAPPGAAAPFPIEDGFVALFNGKNLDGWKQGASKPRSWQVINGVLTGVGGNLNLLYTPRDDYGDFHLRMEARINDDGFGSVMYRYPHGVEQLEKGTLGGWAIRLNGRANEVSKTGSMLVYEKFGQRHMVTKDPAMKPGEWFNVEVIARGNVVITKVNGQQMQFNNPQTDLMGGRIVLEASSTNRNTVLEFRKIEIKEFKAVAPAPPVVVLPPGDFAPLFNGKDLTGWNSTKREPNDWRVINGVLTGTGPKLNSLLTSRNDYGDFHLRMEIRVNDAANGGVNFRYPYDQADLDKMKSGGYFARLNGNPNDFSKTGSVMVFEKVGVRNLLAKEALMRGGDWFTFEIIAIGNKVITKVNGKEAIDFLNPKTDLMGGRIVLSATHPNLPTTVEIRKMEIKEFKVVAPPGAVIAPPGNFVPLFNGKDLAGWKKHKTLVGDWRVANNVLIGTALKGNRGRLETDQVQPKNFHLRAEVRLNDKSIGSISFRSPPGSLFGYEAPMSAFDKQTTSVGGLMVQFLDGGMRGFPGAQKAPFQPQPGEWFTIELIADGNRLITLVNGKEYANILDGTFADAGHINLTTHLDGAVEFRKIEIKDLGAPPIVLAPAGDFAPLFNGKDLTGWKNKSLPEDWRVENGVLIGAAAKPRTIRLHTENQYKDFHLRARVRSGDKNVAYIGFRSPDGILRGYNTSMISLTPDGVHAGTFNANSMQRSFTLRHIEVAKIPPGQWFDLEIIAQGNRLIAFVDGKKTADVEDASMPDAGFIYLGLSGAETFEFRKLEIKELNAVAAPPIVAGAFVPLFNGKDLTGWKEDANGPGTWTVQEGTLIAGRGNGKLPATLATTQMLPKNFHLRMELRTEKSAGNFLLRANAEGTTGYQSHFNYNPNGNLQAGNIFAIEPGKSMQFKASVETNVAKGEWFTAEYIFDGNRLTTKVNGITLATVNNNRYPDAGHLVIKPWSIFPLEFRKIEVKDLNALPVVVAPARDFVKLFNGKDLTGWKEDKTGGGEGIWRVENGTLIGTSVDGRPPTLLLTEQMQPKDFHLRMEARTEKGAGFIMLRSPAGGRAGYQSIFQRSPFNGDLSAGGLNSTVIGSATLLTQPRQSKVANGDWFTLEFIGEGNRLIVKVDGVVVTDIINNTHIDSGHIVLRSATAAPIEFRKIEIKDLKPGGVIAPPVPAPGNGFVPLFNGKDLTDWKEPTPDSGHWRIENGHLVGTDVPGKPDARIHTAALLPKDFHLRMQGKLTGVGSSLIHVRSANGSLMGYQTIVQNAANGDIWAGGLASSFPGDSKLLSRPALVNVAAHGWFLLEVIAEGNRVVVKVDGKTMADVIDNNSAAPGYLVIGESGKPRIEYRLIEVKDLKLGAVIAPAAPREDGFVPIFNGKDLTGWKEDARADGNWRVDKGILIGTTVPGKNLTRLVTENPVGKDIHFRAETRLVGQALSSVIVRNSGTSLNGYEASMQNLPTGMTRAGGVTSHVPGFAKGMARKLDPKIAAGDWFLLEIIANGKQLTVKVDGETTLDVVDDSILNAGHVALMQIGQGSLEFRKIEVKELKANPVIAPAPPVFPPPGDFVQLFNGKDLTGWKEQETGKGTWRVENGHLVGNMVQGRTTSLLSTQQVQPLDFHLRIEARSDKGAGAVFVRSPTPRTDGYESPFQYSHVKGNLRAGGLAATVPGRTSLLGLPIESKVAANEWFTLEYIVEGNRVIVKLNGETTAEAIDETHTLPGLIVLRTASETKVEFRKIEIKPLKRHLIAAPVPPPSEPIRGDRFPVSVPAGNMGKWRVENKELIEDQVKSPMQIFFGDSKWRDYDFSVDVMRTAGDNQAGLWFRRPHGNDGYFFGFGLRDDKFMAVRMAVGIDHLKPMTVAKEHIVNGRWHTAKVSIRGDNAECFFDGAKIYEIKVDSIPAGGVGLRTWMTPYRFKNIKVTAPDGAVLLEGLPDFDLKPAPLPPLEIPKGGAFVPLWDGKDLQGWLTPPNQKANNWRLENGVLSASGTASNRIHMPRDDYKDFHLKMEAKISDQGTGSVIVRAPINAWRSFEARLNANHPTNKYRTGTLLRHIPGLAINIGNVEESPVRADEWFTLEVIAVKDRVAVRVNGKTTADFAGIDPDYMFGHIGFLQDPGSRVEFRKMEIKEFPTR